MKKTIMLSLSVLALAACRADNSASSQNVISATNINMLEQSAFTIISDNKEKSAVFDKGHLILSNPEGKDLYSISLDMSNYQKKKILYHNEHGKSVFVEVENKLCPNETAIYKAKITEAGIDVSGCATIEKNVYITKQSFEAEKAQEKAEEVEMIYIENEKDKTKLVSE